MGLRWDLARSRSLMRTRGCESVADEDPPSLAPLARRGKRRRLSKAQLRAQAADALASFTGTVTRVPAQKK
jgi:hypothetical protein